MIAETSRDSEIAELNTKYDFTDGLTGGGQT